MSARSATQRGGAPASCRNVKYVFRSACAVTPSRSAGWLRSASTVLVCATSGLMMLAPALVRLYRVPLLVGSNGPDAGRSAVSRR